MDRAKITFIVRLFNCLYFLTWPLMPVSNSLINQIWRPVNFSSGDFWTECEWERCLLRGPLHEAHLSLSLVFFPQTSSFTSFSWARGLIKTGEWFIRFWQATPYLQNTCPWRKPPSPMWLTVVDAISTANTIPKLIETRCSVAPLSAEVTVMQLPQIRPWKLRSLIKMRLP